jgi:hypothetical protein
MKGAQSQTESHKDTLVNLQTSRDLKIARKAALEAEHPIQCLERLPRADGKFSPSNVKRPWCNCEILEHLNASVDV